MITSRKRGAGPLAASLMACALLGCGLCLMLLAVAGGLTGSSSVGTACGPSKRSARPSTADRAILQRHRGRVGGEPRREPDSFAELGGTSFATATALGGLPYGTALQITAGRRTMVAYKEDIGLGGGPIDGRPRVIDLWWQLARSLGIPYEDGRWSGIVKLEPLAEDCSQPGAAAAGRWRPPGPRARCCPTAPRPPPRRHRRPSGASSRPATRSPASPYLYGGAHGLPLNVVAPYYDCSSSVVASALRRRTAGGRRRPDLG